MAALCSPQRKDTLESDGDGGAGITFSKFKYRFQNLLTEVRALKSKECSARMEAEVSVQKLRSKEADQDKEKASLQAQITEATEARQKLENAIKIMELEMSAMEKNVASSKMQLKAVLDSRNTVMEELKIANYELEQKLKNTSSHLSVAMEKLSRNTMLFEAVEQEASSVKRTLDETRQIVASRADMVAELQQQVAWLVDIEQKLLDKARLLECELRNKNVSCSKKEKEIIALRHMLDTRNDSSIQEKLTIIQKSSEAKDRTISVLTMDKQGLIGEIESLKAVVKRFQEAAAEQDSSSKILREKVLDYQHLLREKSKMGTCQAHKNLDREIWILKRITRQQQKHKFKTNHQRVLKKSKSQSSLVVAQIKKTLLSPMMLAPVKNIFSNVQRKKKVD
ncbi:protein Daple isoform X2 [Selaginella moellendorffii]|uniref:protein Daple isoform X2 n=1 Tax=Selaginella moellendorffii TaxID=88036 RepID=UPI000D1CC10B|nr:protein Daple isoform X2 [Selaginella moellendorffii]|eukprot:XP_024516697.1 protein Daple isoform X2 [Selaginella moellendorffii]